MRPKRSKGSVRDFVVRGERTIVRDSRVPGSLNERAVDLFRTWIAVEGRFRRIGGEKGARKKDGAPVGDRGAIECRFLLMEEEYRMAREEISRNGDPTVPRRADFWRTEPRRWSRWSGWMSGSRGRTLQRGFARSVGVFHGSEDAAGSAVPACVIATRGQPGREASFSAPDRRAWPDEPLHRLDHRARGVQRLAQCETNRTHRACRVWGRRDLGRREVFRAFSRPRRIRCREGPGGWLQPTGDATTKAAGRPTPFGRKMRGGRRGRSIRMECWSSVCSERWPSPSWLSSESGAG